MTADEQVKALRALLHAKRAVEVIVPPASARRSRSIDALLLIAMADVAGRQLCVLELKGLLGMNNTAMSHALQPLGGLIVKRPDPEDHRRTNLELSKAGKQALAAILEGMKK